MGEEEEGGGGFSWDQVVQANTAEEPALPQVRFDFISQEKEKVFKN